MVNSVSSVRFRGNEEMLSRPGAFSKPVQDNASQLPTAEAKPKKSKAGKIALGILAATVAVLGSAAALKHFNVVKSFEGELANAKLMEKVSHYVAEFGQGVINKSKGAYEWVAGLFKSKAA